MSFCSPVAAKAMGTMLEAPIPTRKKAATVTQALGTETARMNPAPREH